MRFTQIFSDSARNRTSLWRRLVAAGLALSLVCVLAGCGATDKPKEFTSYIPPEKAQMNETVKLDPSNEFRITGQRVEVDTSGRRVLLASYDWKNTGKKAVTGLQAYVLTATQDGAKLKPDLELVRDKKKLVTELAPGKSLEGIEQGYLLDNEKPVTLTLTGKVLYVFRDGKPGMNHSVKILLPALK